MESKQAKCTNSKDVVYRLRSRERARHVPARVVGRGLSRPLPDNTASVATWLDAGKQSREGDLTRKRSLVQIQYGPPGQAHIPGSLSGRSYSRICATCRRASPRSSFLAMPGCSHPESASGVEEAHEIVTLGQVLDLLGVDPHQRANLLTEQSTYDTKPLRDEVGPDGQPQELIAGPDA